jgi:hypothetical protein
MGRGSNSDSALAAPRGALSQLNFRQRVYTDSVSYVPDWDYHDEHCGAGFCRCRKLRDVQVQSADLSGVAELAFGEQPPLTAYALERMLRALQVYKPEHWRFTKVAGYYGEEVGEIKLVWEKAAEIEDEAAKICALPEREQIEHALVLEYGYLLDEIKGRDWKVETVPLKHVVLGQREYKEGLDRDVVARYKHYQRSLPHAICLASDPLSGPVEYRVIDGYHRITAANERGLVQLKIIVG